MNSIFNVPYVQMNLYYHWTILILCIILAAKYLTSSSCEMLTKQYTPFFAVVLSVFLMFVFGFRIVRGGGYGDTYAYSNFYYLVPKNYSTIATSREWAFEAIQAQCRIWNFTASQFFLVIAIGYIGFMLWAYWKALYEDVWFAMMFAFSAYSFIGYGINGIRNGLACSMVTLAFVLMANRKNLVTGIILCILAVGVHKSVALPIAAFFASLYIVKNIKWAILFWFASIAISLVAGTQVQNMLLGLGFDDRLDEYMTSTEYLNMFRHQGFRWDFLLYSSVPVFFAWYIVMKKQIRDNLFQALVCTYILSNSFWVMICRTTSSNRFAYLSWFIYPLVIAYATIRIPIWPDQDRRAGYILLGHAAFFMGMYLLGM